MRAALKIVRERKRERAREFLGLYIFVGFLSCRFNQISLAKPNMVELNAHLTSECILRATKHSCIFLLLHHSQEGLEYGSATHGLLRITEDSRVVNQQNEDSYIVFSILCSRLTEPQIPPTPLRWA